MVVRLPVVVKVKATDVVPGFCWQVPSQCVGVLQRRTLDARLMHHYHRRHHLLLNPMMRMKTRTKTETALWLVVLSEAPP